MLAGSADVARPSATRRSDGADQPGGEAPTILHVTECLAAGVGLSMARLARLQRAAGARPVVIASRRYDTPPEAELREWFGGDVELHISPSGLKSRSARLSWLARETFVHLRREAPSALHLHSSFAGAVGRVVAIPFAARTSVVYSPHGFSFLRTDIPDLRRRALLLTERLLARLPGRLVLVSRSEMEVARRSVTSRVLMLENGADLEKISPAHGSGAERPTVAMIGRVTEQKAPWRFAAAARTLGDRARFVWLGYGPEDEVDRWFAGTEVEVSGQLDHATLLERLRAADLVYFPTLWEGMPLSLIEAQAAGLPVVASAIEGNSDVVIDGETGYLREDEGEMLRMLRSLIDDRETRTAMGERARVASARFSDAERARKSFQVYGIPTPGGPTA